MTTTLQFPQPLRDALLAVVPAAPPRHERAGEERERAAYERGRAEAEKALRELMVKQRAELQELQTGVLQSLRAAVPKVVRDAEDALVGLAVQVAQKLVVNLPISAEMVEAAVREALAQVEQTTEFLIYVHPDDLALLRQANSSLLAAPGAGAQMHFQGSPEVSRGGCLVRTRFGVIDARRETKLELLKNSLQS